MRNFLASTALALAATAACSAPQRTTPEDRAMCSMAIDYFGHVVGDVEHIIYDPSLVPSQRIVREIQKRILDAASVLKRDCGNISDDDGDINSQIIPIQARLKRMEDYMRSAPSRKKTKSGEIFL